MKLLLWHEFKCHQQIQMCIEESYATLVLSNKKGRFEVTLGFEFHLIDVITGCNETVSWSVMMILCDPHKPLENERRKGWKSMGTSRYTFPYPLRLKIAKHSPCRATFVRRLELSSLFFNFLRFSFPNDFEINSASMILRSYLSIIKVIWVWIDMKLNTKASVMSLCCKMFFR